MATRTPFTGCGTALVTPFTTDGALDEPAITRLARRQVEAAVSYTHLTLPTNREV